MRKAIYVAILGVILMAPLGCTKDPSAAPASEVDAQKSRRVIDEIVAVKLFSEMTMPSCDQGEPTGDVRPCWSTLTFESRGAEIEADGKYRILLPETSVPRLTSPWVEVGLIGKRIHSISVDTTMTPENAVPMLVQKYGVSDMTQPADYRARIVRWFGEHAELVFVPHFMKYGEHSIVLQSYEYSKRQNDEFSAKSSKSF